MLSLIHLRRTLHRLYSSFFPCGAVETAASNAAADSRHLFAVPAGRTSAPAGSDEAAPAFPATPGRYPKNAYRRKQRGQRYSFLTYSGALRQVDG